MVLVGQFGYLFEVQGYATKLAEIPQRNLFSVIHLQLFGEETEAWIVAIIAYTSERAIFRES